jgi:helix-turn-helix protein
MTPQRRDIEPEDRLQIVKEIEEDEEPTELELAEIKIKHLEEALKKTEQFKPATVLQEQSVKDISLEEFLRQMANGTTSFYYDSYGIDLFKNRELAQLKNSGVKVFKRLYFEV